MDDKKLTVERVIPASTADIFNVLTNPKRHVELDGSGFVRADEHGERIKAVGDVFTMSMEGAHMGGEYKTDNHVSGYSENALVAWKTAPAGTEPPGWEWIWQLTSQGTNETLVQLTYDWSKVTDKELLKKVSFPLVTEDQLQDSLVRLTEAVTG